MNSLSLKETILPQPPSFHRKKHYEIHQVLGTGSFGKVLVSAFSRSLLYIRPLTQFQHATWHVPPSQESIARRGAAAASTAPPHGHVPDMSRPGTTRTSSAGSAATNNSLLSIPRTSVKSDSSNLTVDVALKVIPNKKVKGNEDTVWGEMEVLKGLDHPNIVRYPLEHIVSPYQRLHSPF
jgi:calcium/calmodulin-dependent protein kinase I